MNQESTTYRDSGVDIEAGDRFVHLISPLARATFGPRVMADIGSFNALFRVPVDSYREPVLVSGTDGVGTKLKIAFMTDRHDTIGIDLVAMCVNDIITAGAEPLFFLDYFATGSLNPEKAVTVVKGIADGCREAGCSLIGGETAEMPGFYSEGEYDLAGFAVGVVEREGIIDGKRVAAGDEIVGIPSSGVHSNGFSLVRKIFFENLKCSVGSYFSELGCTLGEELLKPTVIYAKACRALAGAVDIRAMAHITGGGISGNLPRSFPDGFNAVIRRDSWHVPPIFNLVLSLGKVDNAEMEKTFNMGIGYILIVRAGQSGSAIKILSSAGCRAVLMGHMVRGAGRKVVYV